MTDARLRLIISGFIGCLMSVTICVMWITGQQPPDPLLGLVAGVWGFFTGHVYTNGTGAPSKGIGPQGIQGPRGWPGDTGERGERGERGPGA